MSSRATTATGDVSVTVERMLARVELGLDVLEGLVAEGAWATLPLQDQVELVERLQASCALLRAVATACDDEVRRRTAPTHAGSRTEPAAVTSSDVRSRKVVAVIEVSAAHRVGGRE